MKTPYSIPIQLLILVLSVVFSILFASLIGGLTLNLTNGNSDAISLNDPKSYLILGFFSQFVGFIGGFFLFLKMTRLSFKDLILIKRPELKMILIVLGVLILSIPLINIFSYVNSFIVDLIPNNTFILQEIEIKKNQFNLLSERSFLMMTSKLFVIALLPAIGEELVFRGVMLKKIQESSNNEHYSVIVSASIFAAVHQQPTNLLPMIFLGLILGYIYTRTNNILYSMLFHFLFNGMTVMSVYFYPDMLTQ